MASENADLYNNPEFSDMEIILTTESSEECRARLARGASASMAESSSRATRASSASTSAPTDEPPVSNTDHHWEVVHGHKVVLCRKSSFFRSAHYFKAACSNPESREAKRRKVQPTTNDTVIFDSLQPDEMPTVKDMLQFMYTNQLQDGIQHIQVISLYQLGDQYDVSSLRQRCLEHLAAAPFADIPVQVRQQVFDMVHSDRFELDAQADGPVGEAAAALKEAAVQHVAQLNTFWQLEDNRHLFQKLPQQFIMQVLQSQHLSSTYESTVLVAVLAWLRGEEGLKLQPVVTLSWPMAALESQQQDLGQHAEGHQKRKEVLEAVRLLQLQPWFLSWFLQHVPEAKELLDKEDLGMLGQYFAYSEQHRAKLRGNSKTLYSRKQIRRWATPRKGPKPMRKAIISGSWPEEAWQAALEEVRNDSTCVRRQQGTATHFDGFEYSIQFVLAPATSEGAGHVWLWVGFRVRLWVGDGVVGFKGLPSPPVACREIRRGIKSSKVVAHAMEGSRGFQKSIAPDADVVEVLGNWLDNRDLKTLF